MSEMSTELKSLPKPIKGAGLTNAGVVVLQLLLILLVETIEYSAGKVGIFTGLAIIFAVVGAFYLGRPGTEFATIVNPPIVFFFSSILLIATVGGSGLHVTKFGVDLVTTLGGAAPYLVFATLCGWGWYIYNHLRSKRGTKVDEGAKVEVDPIYSKPTTSKFVDDGIGLIIIGKRFPEEETSEAKED
jgi:membrane-bound ClpP family serine protease